jgi:hypothetical protein
MRTITKEDTGRRAELEFVAIVRTKVRVTSATKYLEKSIVRVTME